MTSKPVLILASNSPRRRELLALGGWTFHIQPAEVDERQHPGEAPDDYVLRLAESKARACAARAEAGQTIVAADTTVAVDGDVLGKPADRAAATAMLRRLRGRSHQVYTAIAVLRTADGKHLTDLCATEVPMRTYSDEELDAYVQSGDPLDKAGAYGIQHAGFHPVDGLRGCFASVMGLPLCHLVRTLRRLDMSTDSDVPGECQAALNYQCPIFRRVLHGEQVG